MLEYLKKIDNICPSACNNLDKSEEHTFKGNKRFIKILLTFHKSFITYL